jgi:hypothetical protein
MADLLSLCALKFPFSKSVKLINSAAYENHMEDQFDTIPVPYRTERLGRMRELIIQIEADCKRYEDLKQKIEAGIGDSSDIEELHRMKAWMNRDMTAYRRLNAISIEGITFVGMGEFCSPFCLKKL